VSIGISTRDWIVASVAIQIECLRIREYGIGHANGLRCPVWRDEPAQPVRVIPCAEVIESGLGVAFFAGTT
jgi:hypothetical protein